MHELRWMAPVLVGVSTVPGVQERDAEGHRSFWRAVREHAGRPEWSFHRTGEQDVPLGWSTAAGEVLLRPLEILTAQVPIAELPAELRELFADLEVISLAWTLYDHGVLLAEGRLRTRSVDGETPPTGREAAAHHEAQVQAAGEALTDHCARTELPRLLEAACAVPRAQRYLEITEIELDRPLWVTRALDLHPGRAGDADLARHWVAGIDGDHEAAVEAVISGERASLAKWMNHVHRTDRPADVQRLWASLRRAQFFWSAMQRVDGALREILAWSMADRTQVSLTHLRTELWATVDEAQELLMLRADVRQRASRIGQAQMQEFLDYWGYDDLLEQPVREKVEYCKERLSALQEERAARSGMFTDIILMSIGVTSVLATAIALVQFGREARTDPSQSTLDLGSGSITSWLSSQSMDAILLISCVVSLILVITFIWKRRQSVS